MGLAALLDLSLVAAFPVCVYFAGEGGVLLASAAVVVVLLSSHVIVGLKPGVIEAAAISTFHVFLAGLGLSVIVMMTAFPQGNRLVLALLLILALGSAPYFIRTAESRWQTAVAGLLAAQIGAAASLLFLGPPVKAGPMLFIGLVTALAAATGRVSGPLVRIHPLTSAFLLSAPTFYFGFKFFLT